MDIRDFRASKAERARLETQRAEAYRAVGSTPDQQAKWILDLAERDLASRAEVERSAAQIRAFTSYGLASQSGPTLVPVTIEPKPAEVSALRDQLRTFLDEIGDHGCAKSPVTLDPEFWWNEATGVLRAFLFGGSAVTRPQLFFALATHVLGQVRLFRCKREKCRKFFVPRRRDQRYCEKKCKDAVGQETLRNRQSEEDARERRHRKYERKVRRLHPKARVGRRLPRKE
jgi:hypothetical protein